MFMIFLFLLIVALLALALFVFMGVRLVPNKRVGIVEKRFGGGSVRSGLIALKGEAGYQPELLRGGLHWLMPWQYAVHIAPLWLKKPTVPGRAILCAKVALNPVMGLMTPRQFGPIRRIPQHRASMSTSLSSAAP